MFAGVSSHQLHIFGRAPLHIFYCRFVDYEDNIYETGVNIKWFNSLSLLGTQAVYSYVIELSQTFTLAL